MQRVTSIARKAGEMTTVCERVVRFNLSLLNLQVTRSFADAVPKIPRKAPTAVPRKAGSTQKVTTRLSNKVAYPLYGTAGIVVGFSLYEVFRCIWIVWMNEVQARDLITLLLDS